MADHQDLPAGQAYTARIDVRINAPRENVRSGSLLHDNRLPLKSLQMCHCWEPQKLLAVAEVLQAHVEDLPVAMQQLLDQHWACAGCDASVPAHARAPRHCAVKGHCWLHFLAEVMLPPWMFLHGDERLVHQFCTQNASVRTKQPQCGIIKMV